MNFLYPGSFKTTKVDWRNRANNIAQYLIQCPDG